MQTSFEVALWLFCSSLLHASCSMLKPTTGAIISNEVALWHKTEVDKLHADLGQMLQPTWGKCKSLLWYKTEVDKLHAAAAHHFGRSFPAKTKNKKQDGAASTAEGSKGGARAAAGGQSHRRRSQQALQNQGGEAFDRAGAHRCLTKTEVLTSAVPLLLRAPRDAAATNCRLHALQPDAVSFTLRQRLLT